MRAVPLGREEESSSIYNLLKEAIQHKQHGVLYVSGMPGCGKTLTCRSVLDIVADNFKNVQIIEINCGNLILPSDIFVEIHKKLDKRVVTSSLRAVEQALKSQEYSVILIDEIDMVISKELNILYGLLELPSLCGNLYIVGISNTYNLPDTMLNNKLRSRLGWNRINFPIYKKSQIVGILRENKTEVEFTPEALDLCANKIGALNGDLRKAFQMQKQAVEQSQKSKTQSVGVQEMEKAMKHIFHSMQSSFIRSLSEYQKLMLRIVAQKKRLNPDELYTDLMTVLSQRGHQSISFKEYQILITKMNRLGVLKGRKSTVAIETDYVPEELEMIFQEEDNDDLEMYEGRV